MTVTGRPTKYKPEHAKKLIEFFDIEPYQDKELPHYDKDGNVKWTDFKRIANRLPTLREFAKTIGIHISTVYDWLNPDHGSYQKSFADAFTHAKDLQKWFLIENGLNNCYNPAFAIFTAKNITDMRDQQVIESNTNMHVTGLEKLNDKQLDELITALKSKVGMSVAGEGAPDSARSTEVQPAAPQTTGSKPQPHGD